MIGSRKARRARKKPPLGRDDSTTYPVASKPCSVRRAGRRSSRRPDGAGEDCHESRRDHGPGRPRGSGGPRSSRPGGGGRADPGPGAGLRGEPGRPVAGQGSLPRASGRPRRHSRAWSSRARSTRWGRPSAGQVKVGDRVFGIVAGGAQAEFLVTHPRMVVPIPSGLDFEAAAAVPEVFITAHDALTTQGRLAPGERVLIHAAGSGVGTAAVQIARAMGCTVFGTSRTAEKLETGPELGLDVGIVNADGDFADRGEPAGPGRMGRRRSRPDRRQGAGGEPRSPGESRPPRRGRPARAGRRPRSTLAWSCPDGSRWSARRSGGGRSRRRSRPSAFSSVRWSPGWSGGS